MKIKITKEDLVQGTGEGTGPVNPNIAGVAGSESSLMASVFGALKDFSVSTVGKTVLGIVVLGGAGWFVSIYLKLF